MKTFFSTLIIIFSLISIPQSAMAQRSGESFCTDINSEDQYTECCSGSNASKPACVTYKNNNQPNRNLCTSIRSEDDYTECCKGNSADSAACMSYYSANYAQGNQGTIGSSNGPGNINPQTIGSGLLNINPQNGGATTAVIAPTPQASAQALKGCNKISFDSLLDILIWFKCIIGVVIIPLIFTLAFLFFIWAVTMFIKGSDDSKKREEYKKTIYWGIIGLTVMVGIWGIVSIVSSTFGLGNVVPVLQTEKDCLTTNAKNPCKKK